MVVKNANFSKFLAISTKTEFLSAIFVSTENP